MNRLSKRVVRHYKIYHDFNYDKLLNLGERHVWDEEVKKIKEEDRGKH